MHVYKELMQFVNQCILEVVRIIEVIFPIENRFLPKLKNTKVDIFSSMKMDDELCKLISC